MLLPFSPTNCSLDSIASVGFNHVQMSGFHFGVALSDGLSGCAIVAGESSDFGCLEAASSYGNLFTNGVGSNGRLGLGADSPHTVMAPAKVGLNGVLQLAFAADHSLAIIDGGRVFAWGSNKYSQLGVRLAHTASVTADSAISSQEPKSVDCKTKGTRKNISDPEISYIPVEVQFKRAFVLGIACSKFHSVAYCENAVYSWGTNNGQLGFQQDIQMTPRKITSFPQQIILSVAATNTSTAILTGAHEIHVISGYNTQRVHFNYHGTNEKCSAKGPVQKSRIGAPIKLSSGNDMYVCIISGDVYMWSPPDPQNPEFWQQKLYPQSRPRRVWSAREMLLEAADVAIGINSVLIVSTTSGLVFHGERKQKVFKFQKLVHLSNVVSVGASVSGGYFAVRSDSRPLLQNVPVSELGAELLAVFKRKDLDYDAMLSNGSDSIGCHQIMLISRSKTLRAVLVDGDPVPNVLSDFMKLTNKNGKITLLFPNLMLETLEQTLEVLYSGRVCSGTQFLPRLLFMLQIEPLSVPLVLNSKFFDVSINVRGHVLLGHSVLLSRFAFFACLVNKSSSWNRRLQNDLAIDFAHVSKFVFEVVLHFVYTDEISPDLVFSDEKECVTFMLDVLDVATELLLYRLQLLCSNILIRILSIRNVLEILENALMYHCKFLSTACIDFANRTLMCEEMSTIDAIQARMHFLQVDNTSSLKEALEMPEGFKLKSAMLDSPERKSAICKLKTLNTSKSSVETLYLDSVVGRESIPEESPLLYPTDQTLEEADPALEEDLFYLDLDEPEKKPKQGAKWLPFEVAENLSPLPTTWTTVNTPSTSLADIIREEHSPSQGQRETSSLKSSARKPTAHKNPMSSIVDGISPKKLSQRQKKESLRTGFVASVSISPPCWSRPLKEKVSLLEIQQQEDFERQDYPGMRRSLLKPKWVGAAVAARPDTSLRDILREERESAALKNLLESKEFSGWG